MLLQQFCDETGVTNSASVSLFDHHNVIDEMDWDTAKKVGVALDHLKDHASVLLSYGHSHRREAFLDDRPCYPMIAEMDGYIFTDVPQNSTNVVRVYQHDWMKNICNDRGYAQCAIIGVSGDKGQAASLLGKPAILFDDKEENIRQVLQADERNAGCLVRVGSNASRPIRWSAFTPFWTAYAPPSVSMDPAAWCELSVKFRNKTARAAALEQHRSMPTRQR